MKKSILCILLVLSLCVSFVTVGYSDEPTAPDVAGADAQTGTTGEEIQPDGSNTVPEEAQEQTPVEEQVPDVETVVDVTQEETEEESSVNWFIFGWGIAVLVLLIANLVLLILKLKDTKVLENVEDRVYEGNSYTKDNLYDVKMRVDSLASEVALIKAYVINLSESSSAPARQAAPQPVAPPAPVVEQTFEEKLNNALNLGSMASLDLVAVDIADNGGLINVSQPTGSNVLFYCKKESDGVTLSIYPDNKIKDRAWESRYSQWFNITRTSNSVSMVNLNSPLVIKMNQMSGRYDLISKGSITMF